MVKSREMSPEVLIYVQNLKHYFATNVIAQQYFNIKGKEDIFFKYLCEMSQKNFEEHDEPQLSLDQFEELREKIHGPDKKATGLFISLGEYGYLSYN